MIQWRTIDDAEANVVETLIPNVVKVRDKKRTSVNPDKMKYCHGNSQLRMVFFGILRIGNGNSQNSRRPVSSGSHPLKLAYQMKSMFLNVNDL